MSRIEILILLSGLAAIILGTVLSVTRGEVDLFVFVDGLVLLSALYLFRKTETKTGITSKPFSFAKTSLIFWSFLLISATICLVYPGQRSLLFFVFYSLTTVPLVLQIFTPQTDSHPKLFLFELVAVSTLLRTSLTFSYPFSFGNDDFITHLADVHTIISTGHIMGLSGNYAAFPGYQIILTAFAYLTSLPPYFSGYIFMDLAYPIVYLIAYLLVSRLTSDRMLALTTAFLLTFTRNTVYWGENSVPESLGIVLIALAILVLVSLNSSGLMLIIGTALVFTHPPSVVWLLLALSLMYLASKTFGGLPQIQDKKSVLIILWIAGVAGINYSTNAGGTVGLFSLIFTQGLHQPPNVPLVVGTGVSTVDSLDLVVLLLFFALGFLFAFDKRRELELKRLVPFIVCGIFLSVFVFPNPISNTTIYNDLQGFRWGGFAELFAVPVAAIGIVKIASRSSYAKPLLIVSLFVLALVASVNGFTALDHPYTGAVNPGSYFTLNELSSLSYASYYHGSYPLTVDEHSFLYLQGLSPEMTLAHAITGASFLQNGLSLVRFYRSSQSELFGYIQNGTLLGGRIGFQVTPAEFKMLHQLDQVYDSSQVAIFARSNLSA